MLGRKGQALVEFILILPVFIMLLLSVIDFGRIFVNKNELETSLGVINDIDKSIIAEDNIKALVNQNKTNKIDVSISEIENGYYTITLTRQINIITPGLNLVLSSPYEISASRVVKYE